MAKIGIELNLFDILAASESPLTSATLAEKTGVDPILMSKFYGLLPYEAINL